MLHDWNTTKQQLEILEEKIQKYKTIIAKEMNKRDIDEIHEGDYIVKRRRNTKTYISKENVPEELWKRYSTKSSFDAFYLSKEKNKITGSKKNK